MSAFHVVHRLAIYLGQKLLNRTIRPLPSQQNVEQALLHSELGPLGPQAPACGPEVRQPGPWPTGSWLRTSYLDSESRRVRQEGRDRAKGLSLRGDPWVFLMMR